MIVIKVNYTTDQPIIKVNYDDAPIYISTSVDATYINVDYGTGGGGGGGTIWGDITGNLSDQIDLQAALDAKVPYTGATANVDLGEYELKAGQIELDQSPTGTAGVAVTRWNDTIGSTETTLKGGNVILKNGVDLVARVVNKVTPNTTLSKASYQAVKVSGAQGQRLAVALAQANNDNNSADTLGLVIETIATNQEGFIMTVGNLEGINTTGSLQGETWADGDVLYLSPTIAGRLTNIKPNGSTGHIVVIGYVEYAHANNGKIYVKIMNGWELDELHNVFISSPANNDALIYESSTSLWKNKSIATALGYTPGTVSSVALSVPTGLVITSGSPITTSGTIAVGLQSGYSIPTTVKQGNWDDAYTFVSAFPSQTGNSGKYLTTDGSTLSWGTVSTANIYNSDGTLTGNRTVTMGSNTLNFNGSVGIGGTPTGTYGKLSVFGGISIKNDNNAKLEIGRYSVGSTSSYIKLGSSSDGLRINNAAETTDIFTLFNNGNLLLESGITLSDTGYKIDVNGTSRFRDNMLLTKNQNAITGLTIENNTSGTSSYSLLTVKNGGGFTYVGKLSGSTTGYKIIVANDSYLSTGTGDIAIHNDNGTGVIKFGTGGTSTAQATLTAAGRLLLGTTTESTYLLDVNGTGRFTGRLFADTEIQIQQIKIGYGNSTVLSNTSVGDASLASNTTGSQNVSFGLQALTANTQGSNNSAFGSQALTAVTTGQFNVGLGRQAGQAITTQNENVAIGYQTLAVNSAGRSNVAVGMQALRAVTGDYNTVLGNYAMLGLTNGSNNIAIGSDAGRFIADGTTAITTSNQNIFIGINTKANANTQTNQIVIGYGTTGLGSNTTIIGNSSTTDTAIYGRMLVNYGTPVIGTYALDVNGTGRFVNDIISSRLLINNSAFGGTENVRINGEIKLNGSGTNQVITFESGKVVINTFTAAGTNSVSILGTATQNGNIGIGGNAGGASAAMSVGYGSNASGSKSVALGGSANATGTMAVALGYETRADANEFVVGSPYDGGISEIYFGSGKQNYFGGSQRNNFNGISFTINGSGASGTDFAGGNITIAGGKGTGTGTPGDVIFATATATTTGTTLQSLTNRARIKGGTGQLILNAYTSTSSFSGTAAGYLAFDASGNVITTAAPSGTNIYNSDGTLTGNRTITSGGFNLTFTGSNTASSALATGIGMTHTLVAAANNDVLVGLDVNPTFTNGAFTGVSNLAVRVAGGTVAGNNGGQIGLRQTDGGFAVVGMQGGSWNALGFWGIGRYSLTATPDLRIFSTGVVRAAGNFIVDGNTILGGTSDAGYKLDVQGTGRFTGALSFTGTALGLKFQVSSSVQNGGEISLYTTANTKYATSQFYNSSNVLAASFAYGDSTVTDTYLRDAFVIGARTSTGKLIFIRDSTAIQSMTMFANGNLLIQDGGTHTDSGFKIDVQGTGRFTGALSIDGSEITYGSTGGTKYLIFYKGTDTTKKTGISYLGNTTSNNGGMVLHTYGSLAGADILFGFGVDGSTATVANTKMALFNSTGNLSIGGSADINSAILQLTSTTKGFLPPRMTETQKNAISTPATGLVIYQTDGTEGLYQYKSTGWSQVAGTGGGGGISRSVNVISTTTTAGASASTDYVYLISGTTTLTLPTAVGNTNRYTLKNVGTNTVTINTTSSQTIDGSTSITMAVRYTALDVISDGTNWNII